MKVTRRTALKTLTIGTLGGMVATPWSEVTANTKTPERFFIFCYFSGGWDHLLCLDPRDPNVFTDSKIGSTKIQLGWDRLENTYADNTTPFDKTLYKSDNNVYYGPVMKPFQKHFDKSCVVRGISMDTVSHDVGRRYFLTGMPPAGLNAIGSSLPTRIVAQQGDLTPIPNLVLQVETYNDINPAFASGLKVAGVSDLISTLSKGPDAPDKVIQDLIHEYRKNKKNCDPVHLNAQGLYNILQTSQTKSRLLVENSLAKHFNFFDTSNPEMLNIRKRYGISNFSQPQASAAMAFQAIKNNVAQCITVRLAEGLDAHDETWVTDHPTKLYEGMKALTALVDDLETTPHPTKSGTLLEHTTIVCFSEFTRTPLINNRSGRDHSLVNSCLLIGAGVPHDKVVGASSNDGMNPQPINPKTGLVESGGIILTPRNISASIMKSAGFDGSLFRANALDCLIA